MNARDPLLPLQPDEATALADFAACTWDDEIVPALTDYIKIPAKSPMFDADWQKNGYIERGAAIVELRRDASGHGGLLRCEWADQHKA